MGWASSSESRLWPIVDKTSVPIISHYPLQKNLNKTKACSSSPNCGRAHQDKFKPFFLYLDFPQKVMQKGVTQKIIFLGSRISKFCWLSPSRALHAPILAEAPSGPVVQAWAIPPPSRGLYSPDGTDNKRQHQRRTIEASSARTQEHSDEISCFV